MSRDTENKIVDDLLKDIDNDVLLAALRRRGLVLSVWSSADLPDVLDNVDEALLDSATDEELDLAQRELFLEVTANGNFETQLATRGNEILDNLVNAEALETALQAVIQRRPPMPEG